MMLLILLEIYLLGIITNLLIGFLVIKPTNKKETNEIILGSLTSWLLSIKLINLMYKMKKI